MTDGFDPALAAVTVKQAFPDWSADLDSLLDISSRIAKSAYAQIKANYPNDNERKNLVRAHFAWNKRLFDARREWHERGRVAPTEEMLAQLKAWRSELKTWISRFRQWNLIDETPLEVPQPEHEKEKPLGGSGSNFIKNVAYGALAIGGIMAVTELIGVVKAKGE